MSVTVDEEARTRVLHVYTVSAPVAGRVLRISRPNGHDETSLHVGDEVVAEKTIVAVMQPVTPGLLDVRSRAELEAALVARGGARAQQHDFCTGPGKGEVRSRHHRGSTRNGKGPARSPASGAGGGVGRLLESSVTDAGTDQDCCVQINAPVSGRVLRIVQEDEAVVQAGAPLVQIGDPRDLEIVADFLSAEAVQIKTGAAVIIDGWGGPALRGRVKRVDPAGFVKVSALGIEEQRVGTVIDLVDPPESWSRLGHDFRVIVHVAIWESEDSLTIPVSAVFRRGGRLGRLCGEGRSCPDHGRAHRAAE